MCKKLINDKTVGGLILVAFSLFFIIPAFEYKVGNIVNDAWQPGAGFFPLLSGVLVLISGVILIAEGLIHSKPSAAESENDSESVAEEILGEISESISEELSEEAESQNVAITPEQQRANTRLLIATILTVLVMLVLWNIIGFYPSAILMCLALNFFYRDKPLTSILLTAVLVGFVFLGFTTGLNITFRI